MSTDLMKIPYNEFVRGLFVKPDTVPERIAHAAVGIIGEVVELRAACDRGEQLEELGDSLFYMQAVMNQFPDEAIVAATSSGLPPFPTVHNLHDASEQLLREAAYLLDLAKKSWIYGKPLDGSHSARMIVSTMYQIHILDKLCSFYGFTHKEAENGNRVKLIKRYPGAQYSDHAAQARADKQEGN